MRSLNMTPQDDNKVNYLFRITLDSTVIRLAINDVTLTNHWDGKVLNVSQKQNEVDGNTLITSGGISVLGQSVLIINSVTDNSNFNSWFNDFYPNNSVYLIGRKVEIGIVWEGATSDSQITWIEEMIILDYSYGGWTSTLVLTSNSEFTNNFLPKFKVQKIYNDGVSYYTKEDAQDKVLPLVYGEFIDVNGISALNWETRLAPSILTDARYLQYKFAYHKCHSITSSVDCRLYQLLEGISNYMLLTSYNPTSSTDGIKVNSWKGAYHELSSLSRTDPDGQILGTLYLLKFSASGRSTIYDLSNIQDNDSSNYVVLSPGDRVGVIFEGNVSSSDLGVLSASNNNTRVSASFFPPSANCDIEMKYYNDNKGYSTGVTYTITTSGNPGIYNFGADLSGTDKSAPPFTIEELMQYEYTIENVGSVDLHLRGISIIIEHIFVKRKDPFIANESSLRNSASGGRG